MYCKYCGSELNKDAKFCTNCGASVVSDKPAINNPTPPVNNETPINNVVNNVPQNNKKNSNVIFIIIIVLLLILIGVVSAKLVIDNFGNKRNSDIPVKIDENKKENDKDNKNDSINNIKNDNDDKGSDYEIYNGYKFKKSSDYEFVVKDNNLIIYSNFIKIAYSTLILNGTLDDVDNNYEELMQNFASQGFTELEYEKCSYKGKEFGIFESNEAVIIFVPISSNKLMRFALFDTGEATAGADILDDLIKIINLLDLTTLSASTGNSNYGELKIPDGTKSNIKIDTINK